MDVVDQHMTESSQILLLGLMEGSVLLHHAIAFSGDPRCYRAQTCRDGDHKCCLHYLIYGIPVDTGNRSSIIVSLCRPDRVQE